MSNKWFHYLSTLLFSLFLQASLSFAAAVDPATFKTPTKRTYSEAGLKSPQGESPNTYAEKMVKRLKTGAGVVSPDSWGEYKAHNTPHTVDASRYARYLERTSQLSLLPSAATSAQSSDEETKAPPGKGDAEGGQDELNPEAAAKLKALIVSWYDKKKRAHRNRKLGESAQKLVCDLFGIVDNNRGNPQTFGAEYEGREGSTTPDSICKDEDDTDVLVEVKYTTMDVLYDRKHPGAEVPQIRLQQEAAKKLGYRHRLIIVSKGKMPRPSYGIVEGGSDIRLVYLEPKKKKFRLYDWDSENDQWVDH